MLASALAIIFVSVFVLILFWFGLYLALWKTDLQYLECKLMKRDLWIKTQFSKLHFDPGLFGLERVSRRSWWSKSKKKINLWPFNGQISQTQNAILEIAFLSAGLFEYFTRWSLIKTFCHIFFTYRVWALVAQYWPSGGNYSLNQFPSDHKSCRKFPAHLMEHHKMGYQWNTILFLWITTRAPPILNIHRSRSKNTELKNILLLFTWEQLSL